MGNWIRVTDIHTQAAPGANTNILSTAITPRRDGVFRIAFNPTNGTVFNLLDIRSGTTQTIGMNTSVPVAAGDGWTGIWPCDTDSTYNFQIETDGIIRRLVVDECYGEDF